MPKWSRFHEACLNCGTQRRPHYGKGYCKPCHVMMKLIWAAEKGDMPPHPMLTRDAIVAGLADRALSNEEFRAISMRIHQAVPAAADFVTSLGAKPTPKGHGMGYRASIATCA